MSTMYVKSQVSSLSDPMSSPDIPVDCMSGDTYKLAHPLLHQTSTDRASEFKVSSPTRIVSMWPGDRDQGSHNNV